jgi:hypothetical protein
LTLAPAAPRLHPLCIALPRHVADCAPLRRTRSGRRRGPRGHHRAAARLLVDQTLPRMGRLRTRIRSDRRRFGGLRHPPAHRSRGDAAHRRARWRGPTGASPPRERRTMNTPTARWRQSGAVDWGSESDGRGIRGDDLFAPKPHRRPRRAILRTEGAPMAIACTSATAIVPWSLSNESTLAQAVRVSPLLRISTFGLRT